MKLRGYLYDTLSLLLTLGSFYFFFRATDFLVNKDYIAAAMTLAVGFFVLRVGVEIAKLALVARRRIRETGGEV